VSDWTVHIFDAAGTIENEIRLDVTQADVAKTYALALRSEVPQDWKRINTAILNRWKKSGLVRIKASAWRKVLGKEPF
jgi:hypothetical protein